MRYSVDAMVGIHILNVVKTDSLAHAYRALANAIDIVENNEASQLLIYDKDNDYKVVANVCSWDL
jgi:hypothetical protein